MGKKRVPSKKGHADASSDKHKRVKGYGWLKGWLEKQDPDGMPLSEKVKDELQDLDPAQLVTWLRRLFWETQSPHREKILYGIVPFLSEKAVPFLQEIIASDKGGLKDKTAALTRLVQMASVPDPSVEASLELAGRFIETIFPGFCKDTEVVAEDSCEKAWDHLQKISPGFHGMVLRELLVRFPVHAVAFGEYVLNRDEGVWEEIVETVAENPAEEAARLLQKVYKTSTDKNRKKKIKKACHNRQRELVFF